MDLIIYPCWPENFFEINILLTTAKLTFQSLVKIISDIDILANLFQKVKAGYLV